MSTTVINARAALDVQGDGQSVAIDQGGQRVIIKARDVPTLAQSLFEAAGYWHIEFHRQIGPCMFMDFDLHELPDDQNPVLAEALRRRDEEREALRREFEAPSIPTGLSQNALRQRRYRDRKRNAHSVTNLPSSVTPQICDQHEVVSYEPERPEENNTELAR